MENFSFQFTAEQVNQILRALDLAPHGQVRALVDYIVMGANAQQQARAIQKKAEDDPAQ